MSHDQFIRTTSPEHQAGVRELIERIFERNPDDFYERAYRGSIASAARHSSSARRSWTGSACFTRPGRWNGGGTELVLPAVALPGFPASAHRGEPGVHPSPRVGANEILGLLHQGLEDISASRARLGWGVPFPRPDQRRASSRRPMCGSTRSPTTGPRPACRRPARASWPAQLHVVGQGHHPVPLRHLARDAGGRRAPVAGARLGPRLRAVSRGERFSKSAGRQLDLGEAIDRFWPDAFRYFLLREIPWDTDGNFSWERFEERYISELADGLGNLASRSLAMILKYREGVVPRTASGTPLDAKGARAGHGVRRRDGRAGPAPRR